MSTSQPDEPAHGANGTQDPRSEPSSVDPNSIEGLFLHFLAAFPDSHIVRKHGELVARDVRARAQALEGDIDWAAGRDARHRVLDPFDRALKEREINPGTTGDLTVTSLLADRLWSRV